MTQFNVIQIADVFLDFYSQKISDTTDYNSIGSGESVINSPLYFYTEKRYIFDKRQYKLEGIFSPSSDNIRAIEQKLVGMVGGLYDIIAYVVPYKNDPNDIIWVENYAALDSVNVTINDIDDITISIHFTVTKNWIRLNRLLRVYKYYKPDGVYALNYNRLTAITYYTSIDETTQPNITDTFEYLDFNHGYTPSEYLTYRNPTLEQFNNTKTGFWKRQSTYNYKFFIVDNYITMLKQFHTDTQDYGNLYQNINYVYGYTTTFNRIVTIDKETWNGIPNIMLFLDNIYTGVGSTVGILRITNNFYDENNIYQEYKTEINLTETKVRILNYTAEFGDFVFEEWGQGQQEPYKYFRLYIGNFRFIDEDIHKYVGASSAFYRPYKKIYSYKTVGVVKGIYREDVGTVIYHEYRIDVIPKVDYDGYWPIFLIPGENNLTFEFIDCNSNIQLIIHTEPTMV